MKKPTPLIIGVSLAALLTTAASAALVATPSGPYTMLDPAYIAEIVSTSAPDNLGVGFAPSGALVRSDAKSLYVHSLAADTMFHGAATIHSSTSHAVTGAGMGGWGFVYRPQDGFYYAQSGGGQIKKIDPVTFASTGLPGTTSYYYGMHLLPNGDRVFNDGSGGIQLYNFATATQTQIYNSGTFINSFTSPSGHASDGLAFGQGAIFGNNTDGTITRIDFSGPGFTGTGSETVIANGGGHGDLAAVGPDGSFYVSNNVAFYPDGSYDGYDAIKLSLVGGSGFGETSVPEPASMMLLGSGLLGLMRRGRKQG